MHSHLEFWNSIQFPQCQIQIIDEEELPGTPAMINKPGDIHPDSHIINRYCHTYEFTEQLRTIPFLKIDFAASVPTHITSCMILSVIAPI